MVHVGAMCDVRVYALLILYIRAVFIICHIIEQENPSEAQTTEAITTKTIPNTHSTHATHTHAAHVSALLDETIVIN